MTATDTLQTALKEIQAEINELEAEYSTAAANRNHWTSMANKAGTELRRLKEVREAIRKTGVTA